MIVGVVSVGDHHEDGMEFKQDEAAPEAEAGTDQIEDREQLAAGRGAASASSQPLQAPPLCGLEPYPGLRLETASALPAACGSDAGEWSRSL